jgi:ATP-binding cassette subfamily B protein/subfamily B ATP-binding cassette protein MsbA
VIGTAKDGFRMNNFYRVLRLTLRHRFALFASIASAIIVGVLWGGNIGTIYPFVEVAFQGKSLQQWVDIKLDEAQRTIADKKAQITTLAAQKRAAPADRQAEFQSQIDLTRSRVEAEEQLVAQCRWLRPYLFRYVPQDPFLTLVMFIGVLLLGTALKSVFLVLHTVLVSQLSQRATLELRELFFRRTLRMDVATFNNDGTADLMSRFTHDMENVAGGLEALLGKLVREPLKMICCLAGAAFICWRLLLVSLILAPIAAVLIRWLAKMLKRANRKAMEEMAQLYTTLEEAFRSIKVVKSFTMERQERRQFHGRSKTYYKKMMRIAGYDSMIHPLTEILGMATVGLAMMAGAYLVLKGQTHLLGIRMSARPLEMPTLLLFYGFLIGMADPMRKLSDVFSRMQRGAAAADRIYARLDREPAVRNPRHPRPLDRHARDLVFENVAFAYLQDRPVLHEVNLRIPFGETIGIVGASGCGKSSLVNLIPRFADPTAGQIRLDGIPLTDVRLQDLRGQIGLVTQEPLLFDDTVLNNIRYGSPRATLDQVVAAAQRAHAHRFIEQELPEGYHTIVGPLGGLLSGGQRQRIALARAILRDPSVLILDEATSQIDLESEQIIQHVLGEFTRGRTTLIVTHRLGLLTLANRIVVMQEGRILDVGRHEELLDRCDFYRRLYQIQYAELKSA